MTEQHILDQLERVVEKEYIFGVRHHSPACAHAVVQAAEALQPEAIAVEMPADTKPMLPWIIHDDTKAPIALAVAAENTQLGFYPFADFSPELAIMRWAHRNNVPIHLIDLPVGAPPPADPDEPAAADSVATNADPQPPVDVDKLVSAEAWDTKVETLAVGARWQDVRRAALAVGVGTRLAEPGVDPYHARREAHMRARLAELGEKTLVVVGSYHCLGLLDGEPEVPATVSPVNMSLVRYSFAQLDSRSGYASGIRDPYWQQRMLGITSAGVTDLINDVIVDVARECRTQGEPAGTGEIAEAIRCAHDLARLRGLPNPGRREVLEALNTVFSYGSVTGRGRIVAQALQKVMVGDVTGELPPDAPVPVLEQQVRAKLAELGLPSRERTATITKQIDPFKGGKDFERHLVLAQLAVLDVPYERDRVTGMNRGFESRSYSATCTFDSNTAATLGMRAAWGVNLAQAAKTMLAAELATAADDPASTIDVLRKAASIGADDVLCEATQLVENTLVARLNFQDAINAIDILIGVAGGREPAAKLLRDSTRDYCTKVSEILGGVVVREIAGIAGSDELEHARMLGFAAGLMEAHSVSIQAAINKVKVDGSPLMQGAACAIMPDEHSAAFVGSWIDTAGSQARQTSYRRLVGFLAASRGLWYDHPIMDGIIDRVSSLSDPMFVQALPTLRGAFDTVAPAEREQFLDRLSAQMGRIDATLMIALEQIEANARADVAARARLAALGLADLRFTPAMRWRLILGAEPETLDSAGGRMASALDELYGADTVGKDHAGESDGRVHAAGNGPSQLGVRQWQEEITALFGADQLQEIFGKAANMGRSDVITSLDAESVRPSVELLTTVLNLKGALPEGRLRQLRPLVSKIVSELSKELASQLSPALGGMANTKPSRRKSPRLDLPATVRNNLKHTVMVNSRPQIIPVTPIFRAPERKVSPWHIIVLVDVSGSMEPSTVFAAMTAAILAGVNTFKVSFITFDTSVIDLTGHVEDPLELLLEIKVGGGTNIAQGVRYAASQVTNPTKTILVLISDFEEWGSVNNLTHEIAALADSGVKLIGCAALDDDGKAAYNVGIAESVAAAGMRVACVSPLELTRWVREVIQ